MATNTCRTAHLLLRNVYLRKRWSRSFCAQTKLSNVEIRKKRNAIFDEERKRQLSLITRIEKIQVEHVGPPEDCSLVMNRGLSTPFNCAMHIQELLMTRSALALVNGQPWDMHRPLEEDCEIQFLHFRDEDPRTLNNAFWRTCSFVLGHVMETAFKDDVTVDLVSFPKPSVSSGSFVHDVNLSLHNWKPTTVELNCLSRIAYQLRHNDLKFERLEVDASVAKRLFEDNLFKKSQVPQIAAKSNTGSKVTLYKMGEHIDMSRGPLIASTSQIGRFNVTSIHPVECPEHGQLQRVQGVALPTQVKMHHWAYEIVVKRAAQLNDAPLLSSYSQQDQDMREDTADV
ncbi:large ribosomal subunit protein mL39-like isoform X1 [Haliotis cracherodii]|uniref:large ribosomal subunit protein mL39-like isoform X1 n=1 Tax=Haliotis cracherodii TaxID=6455 RepID=UPI0039E72C59